jgi:hypothetical protein
VSIFSRFCSKRRASERVLLLFHVAIAFKNAQAKADSSPNKAEFGMTGLRHPRNLSFRTASREESAASLQITSRMMYSNFLKRPVNSAIISAHKKS